MIIEKVVDRFMDENTYIIGDEKTKKCAIIDPGGSTIDIFNKIKQHGLTVEYIILTHGHGDHICRVPEIKSKTNAKVIAHVNEEEVLIDRNKNLSAQLPGPLVEFEADKYVQEGDIIELGSHDMFIAEVVAVNVDEKLLDSKGALRLQDADLIAYSHGQYYTLGDNIGKFGYSVKK